VERERVGATGEAVINVFLDARAIRKWANAIGLAVVEIRSGADHFIPLAAPLTTEDGRVMEGFGALGHSICVFEKPASAAAQHGGIGAMAVPDGPLAVPADDLARRDEQIAALKMEVTKLRSSTSWRITQPLRDLRTLLGHALKR
jgi:hypothetical protein